MDICEQKMRMAEIGKQIGIEGLKDITYPKVSFLSKTLATKPHG
jgi:hypothetical protein